MKQASDAPSDRGPGAEMIELPRALRKRRVFPASLIAEGLAALHRMRARHALADGDVQGALRHYLRMARTGSARPGWLVKFAHVAKETGAVQTALQLYRQTAHEHPRHFDASRQTAYLLALQEDPTAIGWLARAMLLDADDDEVRLHLNERGYDGAELERILAVAAFAIRHDDRRNMRLRSGNVGLRGRLRMLLGLRAARRRDWHEAARHRRWLAERFDRPGDFVQLGHALRESGNLDDAKAAYRRAVLADPAEMEGHFYLAYTLRLDGLMAESRQVYFAAWQLGPHHPNIEDDIKATGLSSREVDAIRDALWLPTVATAPSIMDLAAADVTISANILAPLPNFDGPTKNVWSMLGDFAHKARRPRPAVQSDIFPAHLTNGTRDVWTILGGSI